jgi:hypothetical protein
MCVDCPERVPRSEQTGERADVAGQTRDKDEDEK